MLLQPGKTLHHYIFDAGSLLKTQNIYTNIFFYNFIEIHFMKFLSLQPFVPSGKDFEASKDFFQQLGFTINWDAGDYIGFDKDGCKFILQKFDSKDFAENFMITVGVTNVDEFRKGVIEKELPKKFGIRIGEASDQPYGREVNIIDIAGVCWHFVQQA